MPKGDGRRKGKGPWARIATKFVTDERWSELRERSPTIFAFAVALDLAAILHCVDHKTDGFLSTAAAKRCGDFVLRKGRVMAELQRNGRWKPVDGGYDLNAFLDWQESAAEIKARQDNDAERQRNHRARKAAEEAMRADGHAVTTTVTATAVTPLVTMQEVEVDIEQEQNPPTNDPDLRTSGIDRNDETGVLVSDKLYGTDRLEAVLLVHGWQLTGIDRGEFATVKPVTGAELKTAIDAAKKANHGRGAKRAGYVISVLVTQRENKKAKRRRRKPTARELPTSTAFK